MKLMDPVEQALAIALVGGHAVRSRSVRTYGGGLGAASFQHTTEFPPIAHSEEARKRSFETDLIREEAEGRSCS